MLSQCCAVLCRAARPFAQRFYNLKLKLYLTAFAHDDADASIITSRLMLSLARVAALRCPKNIAPTSSFLLSPPVLRHLPPQTLPSFTFQCRSYISDENIRKQYLKLFHTCDLDGTGFVTYEELQSTLFRFGLADLDAKQPDLLKQIFSEVSSIAPAAKDSKADHVDGSFVKTALSPEAFETFIQRSVYIQTTYDNTLPDGKSPLWWKKFRVELRHYASSFNLLYCQTKSACELLIDHGWRMKKEERKIVQVAVFDFLKSLPFVVLLVAPMGSLMVPIVAKIFPQLLPSTFYNTNPEEWNSKVRSDKLAITSLEVATRILRLEKNLREAKEAEKKRRDTRESKK